MVPPFKWKREVVVPVRRNPWGDPLRKIVIRDGDGFRQCTIDDSNEKTAETICQALNAYLAEEEETAL